MTAPTSYTYQWNRVTATGTVTPITGATSSTYTCASMDVGDTITCSVTGVNAAGHVSAVTVPTGTVTASAVFAQATVWLDDYIRVNVDSTINPANTATAAVINKDAADIKATGTTWVRYSPSTANATYLAGIVQIFAYYGIQIIFCYNLGSDSSTNSSAVTALQSIVPAVAAQGCHVWEIGNEPNMASSGWTTTNAVTNYCSRLKAVYPVIKTADPTATVISGGVFYNASYTADGSTTSDNWFSQFCSTVNGMWPYCDGIGVHPYSDTQATGVLANIDEMRSAIAGASGGQYFANKPLCVTGLGWWYNVYTAGGSQHGQVSPATDAQRCTVYTATMNELAANGVNGGTFPVCYYTWADGTGVSQYGYGAVAYTGQTTRTYSALYATMQTYTVPGTTVVVTPAAPTVPAAPTGPTAPTAGYRVVFADDFNGSALSSMWTPAQETGQTYSGANNSYELEEYYTGQVTVGQSLCTLTCVPYPAGVSGNGGTKYFLSGTMNTGANAGFMFSPTHAGTIYIEAKIKIPGSAAGSAGSIFPAYWASTYRTYGQSGNNFAYTREMDFFEFGTRQNATSVGQPNYIDSANIYPSGGYGSGVEPSNNGNIQSQTLSTDMSQAFHLYTVAITSAGAFTLWIDGTQIWTLAAETATDWMGLILNYALVEPPGTGFTSDSMQIDYVAVWQDAGVAAGSGIIGGGIAPGTTVATTGSTSTPANTAVPAIAGTGTVGSALTATTGTWSNTPTLYTEQWYYYTSGTAAASGVVSSVQQKAVNTGTSTTITVPLSASVTASHLLVMDSVQFDNIAVSTVSGGGTWVKDNATSSATVGTLERWYCLSATGGSTTVTVTLASAPGANRGTFMVTEYLGSWSAPTSTPVTNVTSAAPTTASMTPSETGDLLLASMTAGISLTSGTGPSTGWTELQGFTGISYYVADVAYTAATSTGAVQCSWSLTASAPYSTLVSKFRPASTSGPTYTAIAGAKTLTYTPAAADIGSLLVVGVTATNTAGTSTVTYSAPTAAIVAAPVAPTISTAPVVTGALTAGSVLTCSTGVWNNVPTNYAYQWLRDGTPIPGAATNTYTLLSTDLTHNITCTVTASNNGGSNASTSAVSSGTSTGIVMPNIVLPSDAGHIDVTAHGADKTGVTDCTSIINGILTSQAWGGGGAVCMLYFPSGTYKISGTLAPYTGGNWHCSIIFQGQNRDNTIIQMTDGVWTTPSTYLNGKAPYHAMIHLASQGYGQPYQGGGGNEAFNNYVFDLTLNLGNNPGGGALAFDGSNAAAIRRVNITCSGTPGGTANGYVGLDLSPGDNGPLMVQDVNVTGPFTIPCSGAPGFQEFSIIMERVNLGQGASGTTASFTTNGVVWGIKDSTFAQGTTIAGSVANMTDIGYFNCASTITTTNTGGGQVAYYGDGNGNGGFQIAPVNTPMVPWDPISNWANAATMGWQAALNSGKSTVYWPLGNFANPLTGGNYTVPETVNRITWLCGGANIGFTVPFFTTTGTSSTPLVIERSWGGGPSGSEPNTSIIVQHNANRDLVLQDMDWYGTVQGTGLSGQTTPSRIFFDDTCSIRVNVAASQQFFARQFNWEDNNLTAIANNGGQVWCLGLKTERSASSPWITASGGRTEMLAGFNYPGTTPPVSSSLVPYQFTNASFALQVSNNAYNNSTYNYTNSVTLNGSTTGFTYSSASRGIGNYFTASYTAPGAIYDPGS